MSGLTHCDVPGSPQMCYCGIGSSIQTDHYVNHATSELSSYLTKVLLLSGGGCEDMRDFIWLPRSYLINSWIEQNLSRVATTTSARGIEHGPDWDIPPDIRLRKGVSVVRDQSEDSMASPDQWEASVARGECLHCRGSAEPTPPTLAWAWAAPQSILARNSQNSNRICRIELDYSSDNFYKI